MSWKPLYSQDTIINKVQNDSIVRISKSTAIKLLHELNEKDFLYKENTLLKQDTTTLRQLVFKYREDSSLYKKREDVYKSIGRDYLTTVANYNEYIKKRGKQFKWSRTKTTISQIALIAAATFFVLKK